MALGERRRRGEGRVGRDEVLDGVAAGVVLGRVRDLHVLLHDLDVFLRAGREHGGYYTAEEGGTDLLLGRLRGVDFDGRRHGEGDWENAADDREL
jgi:hypothetical protein